MFFESLMASPWSIDLVLVQRCLQAPGVTLEHWSRHEGLLAVPFRRQNTVTAAYATSI